MHAGDDVRLHHMLDAANEAITFAAGRARADLDIDRMLVHALVRCIEIIGEAASQVTVPYRELHPELPWAAIVGMRNRLVHAYFDVDLDRVWDTVQQDLPDLVRNLEPLVSKSE